MEKRKVSLSEFAKRMTEQPEQYSGYMCWILSNDRDQDMIVIWDEWNHTAMAADQYEYIENIAVYFPVSVDDYTEIISIVRKRKRRFPGCRCWNTVNQLCVDRIESIQTEEEIKIAVNS